jgi:hypothetical protein
VIHAATHAMSAAGNGKPTGSVRRRPRRRQELSVEGAHHRISGTDNQLPRVVEGREGRGCRGSRTKDRARPEEGLGRRDIH